MLEGNGVVEGCSLFLLRVFLGYTFYINASSAHTLLLAANLDTVQQTTVEKLNPPQKVRDKLALPEAAEEHPDGQHSWGEYPPVPCALKDGLILQ